jgi:Glycosyl hydrolase family 26
VLKAAALALPVLGGAVVLGPRPRSGEARDLVSRCSFGAHVGGEPYGAAPAGLGGHYALEAEIGAKLSRMVWFVDMDSGWPAAAATQAARTGHTPVISWDVGRIALAEILDGRQDDLLDAFFREARQFPGKVVLRMWWEMNADAARYSLAYPGADRAVSSLAQFKDAWAYVYMRAMVVNGATNVSFFFCANGRDIGPFTMEDYFPGEAYVDQIGFDTYNETRYGRWGSFAERMQPAYDRCAALHRFAPICVGEIGTVDSGGPGGADKAGWLRDMFQSSRYPRLRRMDFFSVKNESDWRIDQTAASLQVCRRYLPRAPTFT